MAKASSRDKVWYRGEDGERYKAEVVRVNEDDTVDLAVFDEHGDQSLRIRGGAAAVKLAADDATQKISGTWWPMKKEG